MAWRGFSVCPLVCYDLRFPVWSRRRPGLDYDLLLYVANWPAARADAWRQLLRARAIENQAYVVGVNRVGSAGDGPALLTVPLPRGPLIEFREKFPAHLDADRFTLELEDPPPRP